MNGQGKFTALLIVVGSGLAAAASLDPTQLVKFAGGLLVVLLVASAIKPRRAR